MELVISFMEDQDVACFIKSKHGCEMQLRMLTPCGYGGKPEAKAELTRKLHVPDFDGGLDQASRLLYIDKDPWANNIPEEVSVNILPAGWTKAIRAYRRSTKSFLDLANIEVISFEDEDYSTCEGGLIGEGIICEGKTDRKGFGIQFKGNVKIQSLEVYTSRKDDPPSSMCSNFYDESEVIEGDVSTQAQALQDLIIIQDVSNHYASQVFRYLFLIFYNAMGQCTVGVTTGSVRIRVKLVKSRQSQGGLMVPGVVFIWNKKSAHECIKRHRHIHEAGLQVAGKARFNVEEGTPTLEDG
ncbi:hypothetical protein Tco_1120871 [Tanacetum coccineum]|uniref:Uncharacterized protein n=1 Tax=Tanacetum coccineum TaxID=301880 RepID=A0ABQ5IWG1_9ASTR